MGITDRTEGVTFSEHSIQNSKFIATGAVRSITFAEPGDVYKFSADIR